MIKKAWLNEKFRYLFIGAYNTFIGYGVFVILWLLFGQTLHYTLILVFSHIISVTNAFFSYRIIVFRKKNNIWGDFIRFNLVYLVTFAFNIFALPFLIEVVNFHPLIAQALVVFITIVLSYIFHRQFSFKVN